MKKIWHHKKIVYIYLHAVLDRGNAGNTVSSRASNFGQEKFNPQPMTGALIQEAKAKQCGSLHR